MLGIYHNPKIAFPVNNLFQIDDPATFECRVQTYDARRSCLKLAIRTIGSDISPIHFHAHFSSVMYFQGPMYWVGANFCVAPPQACLDILRRFEVFNGVPMPFHGVNDDELLAHYTLFTVNAVNFSVQVVAAQVRRINL